jgi:pimeloyl-ACP methyl ester carboxylesterase
MPKTPVVFVPGLGGSFNLTVLLDWRGPTLSGWDFPPFLDYGKTFLATFEQAGYTRDVDLFVAFYDWRKTVSDSATNYLIPWIDRACSRSGHAKVDLVAHSMGGLVSRSYIQSVGYRGDVEQLVTLGTPHRGAPEAYYPWGGGELRWDSTAATVLNVYLWYLARIHPFQTGLDTLQTIRTQAPGIRDLLPIDAYLIRQGPPPTPIPEDQMHQRNLWGDVALTPSGLSTLLARSPLSTISGTGFTTVQALVVQPPPPPVDNPPRWVDGEPVSEQTTSAGDHTVLL